MLSRFAYCLITAATAYFPAQLMAVQADAPTKVSRVLIVVIIALAVAAALAPVFYRRALRKRGEKKLTSFLLNDPETREMLLKRRDGQDEEDEAQNLD